jgi:hypothetical protein
MTPSLNASRRPMLIVQMLASEELTQRVGTLPRIRVQLKKRAPRDRWMAASASSSADPHEPAPLERARPRSGRRRHARDPRRPEEGAVPRAHAVPRIDRRACSGGPRPSRNRSSPRSSSSTPRSAARTRRAWRSARGMQETAYAIAFVDMRHAAGVERLPDGASAPRSGPRAAVVLCTASADFSWQDVATELGSEASPRPQEAVRPRRGAADRAAHSARSGTCRGTRAGAWRTCRRRTRSSPRRSIVRRCMEDQLRFDACTMR